MTTVIVSPIDETPLTVVVDAPSANAEVVVSSIGLQGLQGPAGASPATPGSDKQVIFNDGGTTSGNANLTWDKTTNTLTVGKTLKVAEYISLTGNIGAVAQPAGSPAVGNYFGGAGLYSTGGLGAVALNGNFRIHSGFLSFGPNDDLRMYYGAANVLEQRFGANAQTFRVYNTYTDASNYERLAMYWANASTAYIGTEGAGTGVTRNLVILGNDIQIKNAGVAKWQFNASGHLTPATGNANDFGSAALTVRSGYFGTSVYAPQFDLSTTAGSWGLGISGSTVLLRAGAGGGITFQAGGVSRWYMGNGGGIGCVADNTYDIGTAAADRPKNVHVAGSVLIGVGAYPYSSAGGALYSAGAKIIESAGNSTVIWNRVVTSNPYIALYNGQVNVANNLSLGFSPTADPIGEADVRLWRDGAGQLALRNGASPQLFNIYNAYTDSANYERLRVGWHSSWGFFVGSEWAGSGSQEDIVLSGRYVRFISGATERWRIQGADFLPLVDNGANVGSPGARVANGYFGTSVITPFLGASGAGVPLSVDSTNSNGNKIALKSAGAVDSYLGAGGANVFTVADSVGAQRLTLSASALEQRNGTTAQSFRVYNSYIDASNYDRAVVAINGNFAEFGSEAAGTGVARHTRLKSGAGTSVYIGPGGGGDTWIFTNTGNLVANGDNVYNIGAAASGRPANVYVGSSITSPVIYGSPTPTTGLTLNGGAGQLMLNNSVGAKLIWSPNSVTVDSNGVNMTGLVTLNQGQLKFPAIQNASADPNTLDDYEEGTFTPAIAFTGGSVGMVHTTQTGQYTKVGNRVDFRILVTLSAKGTSTGSVLVTGLPINPVSQTNALVMASNVASWTFGMAYTSNGSSNLNIVLQSATGIPAATNANLTDTTSFTISGTYFV